MSGDSGRLRGRFGLKGVGLSLRNRNYRLYFSGQLLSMMGTWMQAVALAFLVLKLTGSGTDLGLATASRFMPIFVFGPFGGVIADRLDKRRVLYVTQTLSALIAGVFALLIGLGVIQMWMVYLLTLVLGGINVFDNPARQSFIAEMVRPDELSNAITLNSVSLNLARVFGAALGGLFVALLGLVMCFALNGISFAAVLVSLFLMRSAELFPSQRARKEKGQIRAGLRYVRQTPELLVPLIMITVVGTLAWEFQVTLPLMADHVFHGGAGTYGLMASIMGVGAVIGGVVAAARARPSGRALCLASIGWGIAITAAAVAPTLAVEFGTMVFVGYGSLTFNSMAKTMLQAAAVPMMRGRVMALWGLAWLGTTPIGGPLVGWIGQDFGARWSLVAGGVPTILIGVLCWPALRRLDRRVAARQTGRDADPAISEAAA